MDEPYRILGLTMDASPEEVKRAYRKLVMKWHPDRNDAPGAEEHFKRIKAAYELVSNPEKLAEWVAAHGRRKSDRTWGDFRSGGWGDFRSSRHHEGPSGASSKAPEPEPEPEPDADEDAEETPPPIHRVVHLSLLEAAFGCEKTVAVVDSQPCRSCAGSGKIQHSRSMACSHCKGIGRLRDAKGGNITCGHCRGKGFVTVSACPVCAGSGSEHYEKNYKVRIPAGMLEGERVRLPGSKGRGEDTYLAIAVDAFGLLRLHGRDLHCELPLSVFRLLMGGDIDVPSLNGATVLHLEPGIGLKPGESAVHRLPGLGFPGRGQRKAGDLVVRIRAIFPATLSERQREALQKLEDNLRKKQKEQAPELAAWDAEFRAWRDNLPQ